MIVLIDLSAAFFRNYYGTGSDVGAFDITIDQVMHYVKEFEHTAVCCEGGSLLRCDWDPNYKANRPPKPQDAIDSLRAIEQQIESWGVPLVRAKGYEADDVIATLVDQAWLDEVQILGSEKDLYQLISDSVRLIGKRGLIGPAECVEKFGVRPEQIRDWLALCGDVSDNVPGCPGIGPGRARDLLVKFETLDAIMGASDEDLLSVRGIGEKALESLREWDPASAVKLVTLLTDAPVNLSELWEKKAS